MKNKYNAHKTVLEIDGEQVVFDSRREAEWYQILANDESVTNLQRQVPFVLQEKYVSPENPNKTIREIRYIADFVFQKDGKTHVYDIKGVILPEFRLKKKLFDFLYAPLFIETKK